MHFHDPKFGDACLHTLFVWLCLAMLAAHARVNLTYLYLYICPKNIGNNIILVTSFKNNGYWPRSKKRRNSHGWLLYILDLKKFWPCAGHLGYFKGAAAVTLKCSCTSAEHALYTRIPEAATRLRLLLLRPKAFLCCFAVTFELRPQHWCNETHSLKLKYFGNKKKLNFSKVSRDK